MFSMWKGLLFILGIGCLLLSPWVSRAEGRLAFLLGEDIMGPDGIVVSANRIQREAFTSGLSGGVKQDLIQIDLTIVNTGKTEFPVEPVKEFSLVITGTYPLAEGQGAASLEKPFTVNPGTQSRGTLFFKVPTTETQEIPRLVLSKGDQPLEILCDEKLKSFFEKSKATTLDPESALPLARFFCNANRPEEAKKILTLTLSKYPGEPRVILQLGTVERTLGNNDRASDLMANLGPGTGLDREDSLSLARQAFELGQYGMAQDLLENLSSQGKLEDRDHLFLARCWYYNKEYDKSEKLLNSLLNRGMDDKTLFFTLGNIAEKREDWRTAISHWEKALSLDPNYYEALFNAGVGYYKVDEKQRAIDSWKRVLILNPDPQTRQITEDALKSLE